MRVLSVRQRWKGSAHDFPVGPRGVALCVVDLVDVREAAATDSDAACLTPPDGFGFAWLLTNPRGVRHAPVKGKLGLYRATPELMALVG